MAQNLTVKLNKGMFKPVLKKKRSDVITINMKFKDFEQVYNPD